MLRSRISSARRICSSRQYGGASNLHPSSKFPSESQVNHCSITPPSQKRIPSSFLTSRPSFQQNPRFFSQDLSDPIANSDGEESLTESPIAGFPESDDLSNAHQVFDESPSFNLAEAWQEDSSSSSPFSFDDTVPENSEWVADDGFVPGNGESVVDDELVVENGEPGVLDDGVVLENGGPIDDDEKRELDLDKLESVISLLQSRGVSDDAEGSIESALENMGLYLSEEFVIRVLETALIPGENLIMFFKWANGKDFSVTTRSLDALVKGVCSELRKKVAYSLWDLVKELAEKENGVVTTEILNNLISLFSRLGKGMAGYEVFNKFGDFFCVADADSYYFTIEALCRRSIVDRVGAVCEKMINEGKLPETEKVGKIICYLCKAGLAKDAHSVYLLAKEKDKYPPEYSINLLISSLCDRKNNDADSLHLALKMLDDFSGRKRQKYAIKPFSCVVQGLCRINDIEGAKTLLLKMIDAGPPPGNAIFNTIINCLSKAGDMVEATKMLRVMESRGLKPDVFTYSVIMSGYAKGGEMEEATKVLAEAKKNHCKLTPVTYHTIIRGYCKLENFEMAIKLLGEMKEFGVQPNADEYTKLIQTLCLKAANWGAAEKLMEEMKEKGLYLNENTKALVRAVKELEAEVVESNESCGEAEAVIS